MKHSFKTNRVSGSLLQPVNNVNWMMHPPPPDHKRRLKGKQTLDGPIIFSVADYVNIFEAQMTFTPVADQRIQNPASVIS